MLKVGLRVDGLRLEEQHTHGQVFAGDEELGDFVAGYGVLLFHRQLQSAHLHGRSLEEKV